MIHASDIEEIHNLFAVYFFSMNDFIFYLMFSSFIRMINNLFYMFRKKQKKCDGRSRTSNREIMTLMNYLIVLHHILHYKIKTINLCSNHAFFLKHQKTIKFQIISLICIDCIIIFFFFFD